MQLTKFLLLALIGVFQIECANGQPLRLATYTYATNNRIDNLKPLSNQIEKTLERSVQTRSYPDVASFIDAIKSKEVDIALINTLGYLLLSLDNETMQPVATLKVKKGAEDNYKTVLLTNNKEIIDLKTLNAQANDLTMMFVSEGSTSGNLVPRLLLSSIGINSPETQFKAIQYGGNHTSTFEKLMAGDTDVCAMGSNEYFKQIRSDSTILNSTNLLWMSEEIPLGPVLINNDLSKTDKKKITQLILNLDENNTDALESIKAGWSEAKQAEKFYPITDAYYDNFRMVNGNQTDLSDILDLFTD